MRIATARILTLLVLGAAASASAQGFGVVSFSNGSGINAPFYDADGTTYLAGSTFQAALYFRPTDASPEQFLQAGAPSPFVSNGFWMPGNRTLTGVSSSSSVVLQVRFWDSENGTYGSFEHAEANGAAVGVSIAIVVVLRPPPMVTPMTGLQSAGLMPTITLTRGAPGLVTDSSTVGNGTQLTHLCGRPVGLNRWFRLTSPYPGETLVTTTGSGMDTVMSAYTGSIINPSSLTLITCNDDRAAGVTASEVRFAIQANKLYLLCVAGKNGVTGTIRLNHTLLTKLDIRRTIPDGIELSWPADASNFVAEATSELPASWRTLTNPPTTTATRQILQLDCAAPQEVYRLRLRSTP